jgi:hypothetical protein
MNFVGATQYQFFNRKNFPFMPRTNEWFALKSYVFFTEAHYTFAIPAIAKTVLGERDTALR